VPRRQPESSFVIPYGSSKCASDVAEQFGFKQGFGERPAIHFNQRAAGAIAVIVDNICDQLFSRTGFARNQHG